MYSYEDRVRTVRLYIKYGRSASATIRELGYPSRKNLARWYRAFIEAGDLPAGYRRSRPRYSAERKQIAVDHYLSHGCNFAGTTRALGYPCRAVLAAWGHELRPDIRKRLVSNAPNVPSSPVLKQAAVIELCTRNGGARVIAEKIGVSRPTLYNWQNKLLGREAPASMKRHKNLASAPERAELEQQLESLRRDIRQLQLEHDILKKANELLKKGLGIDPRLLSNREKTTLVDALRQIYALPELLAVLGLARSSYFYHRARLLVADKYAGVRRVITDIFELNYRCYGYRRIRAALGKQRVFISEKVVRRLMSQEGLAAGSAHRRRYGSYQGEIGPAPENPINRDFRAAAPNKKWLTDITEFQIPAGKVYLSPVIDCFDGLVVSWSIGTRPDAELVNTMLDAAIETVADSNLPCQSQYVISRNVVREAGPWTRQMVDAEVRRDKAAKALHYGHDAGSSRDAARAPMDAAPAIQAVPAGPAERSGIRRVIANITRWLLG